jgi:hypothetical protein
MEREMSPQPRTGPRLRRLLAVALSGGLGVFALPVDANAIAKTPVPATATSVSSIDQPGD